MVIPALTMSGQYLQGNLKGSPQFSYLFDIILPVDIVLGIDSFLVSGRIISASLPFDRYEVGSYFHGTDKKNYAKTREVGSLRLTVLEASDGKTGSFFRAWESLVRDPVSKFMRAPDVYKKTVTVLLLNSMGLVNQTIKLEGCFPLGRNEVSLNYEQSSVLVYEVEFPVDDVSAVEKVV